MQRTVSPGSAGTAADRPDHRVESLAGIEAVRLRNYDHWQGHSLHVAVATTANEPVHAERRFLQPGGSTRLSVDLEPGEYEVQVRVDGVERDRATCRLDRRPSGTAVVELGNGAVSLTQGV